MPFHREGHRKRATNQLRHFWVTLLLAADARHSSLEALRPLELPPALPSRTNRATRGAGIRVGTETREWRAGECLIFDDSFEHEVWHDGDSDRVVLICDLCTHACPNTTRACDDFLARPSSAASRLSTNHPLRVLAPVLNSGHPDVDIESMIYPLLSSAQRKAMDYAMAGRHETLQQRTY